MTPMYGYINQTGPFYRNILQTNIIITSANIDSKLAEKISVNPHCISLFQPSQLDPISNSIYVIY